MIENLETSQRLVLHWRLNPIQAAKDIFDVDLEPHQRISLNLMWFNDVQTNILSRGTGKTFLMGLCASLEGILKPGHRIGLIGPSFRQSKLVWDEVDKLYRKSPLFQQSVLKEPAITPEKCYLKFHAAEGKNSTVIEALPLGSDGGKIRGARYFSTYIDEAAQVEKEILDVVVRGFGATSANPVERANFMAQQKRLLAEGLITQDQILKPPSNKEIFSTTAFYQYNHSYERLCEVVASLQRKYKTAQKRGQDLSKFMFMGSPLNSGQIPYRVMSDGKEGLCAFTCTDPREGFMDMDSIRRAKRQMSNYKFLMEYFCARRDTEVITPLGNRPISEIKVGDLVLTHKGRFRRVTEVMVNDFDGPMVALLGYGYNRTIHITANHPLWTGDERWQIAGEMTDNLHLTNLRELNGRTSLDLAAHVSDFLTSTVDDQEYLYPRPSQSRNGKGTNKVFKSSVKRIVPLDYDMGLIVGYYAAEGSVGANGKQLSFALDGHEDLNLLAMLSQIKGAIKRVFGRILRVHDNGNVVQAYISSRLIAELLMQICPGTASEKRIQPEILFSNPRFLRGFLIGYWNGDGNVDGKPQASASSVSRDLVVQVRLALSYFGFASSLRDTQKARTGIVRGRSCDCLPVTAVELKGDAARRFAAEFFGRQLPVRTHNCRRICVANDGQKATLGVRQHEIYQYQGKVYNLEVEEDHSYSLPGLTCHNCFFPPDSEGFFRRSLLDSVRARSDFGPIFEPRTGCLYTMGVDPARSDDNFAIAIFEIDPSAEEIRLVRVLAFNKKSFPEMHKRIRELIRIYKMKYFQMDAGGGGTTIRDLLSDPSSCPPGERLILEQDFDEHRTKTGDRYLGPLVQFSSYEWVQNANFNLKSGLEHKRLAIAAKSPVPGQVYKSLEDAEMYDEADEEIEAALTEWSSIVTTAAGARMHWDTPTKTMRKDRYSAILIGFDAAERVMALHKRPKVLAAGFWG